jgi:4-diphosphocytidyl-2-C-methyl-D-erythritol kinase
VTSDVVLRAPAKLNLCLYLGPRREDGLHELCSLFEPISLEDRLHLSDAERDEVVSPGVDGKNLALAALEALRDRGWDRGPARIEIEKRIPVAAGLGGGSADAAAVLRLGMGHVAGIEDAAMEIGADVPSQLEPMFALVGGAGELVEPLPPPAGHAVLLLPQPEGLGTAEVFAEADRLGIGRSDAEIAELRAQLRDAAGAGGSPLGYPELLVNDLQPAALSLRPSIAEALEDLSEAGATHALLTGSGPTAFGLFEDRAAAEVAMAKLGRQGAIVCERWSGP